ncbi:MAG: T9SS type A sorting domain-containing protein [Bacteroidia bacterium]
MKVLYQISLFVALFLCQQVFGQAQWQNAGPDNLGSRVRAITKIGTRLIAGSSGGGLWYSDDKGVSWKRLESYASAGCNPNVTSITVDGNKIYVATGETEFIKTWRVAESNDAGNYNTADAFWGASGLPGGGLYVGDISGNDVQNWNNNNYTKNPTDGAYAPGNPTFSAIQKVAVFGNSLYLCTRNGIRVAPDKTKLTDAADWVVPTLTYDVPGYMADSLQSPSVNNKKKASAYDITEIEDANGQKVLYATWVIKDGGQPRNGGWLGYSTNGGVTFRLFHEIPQSTGERARASFDRAVFTTSKDKKTLYVAGTSTSNEVEGVWRLRNGIWDRFAPRGNAAFAPLGGSGRDAFTLASFPDATGTNEHLLLAGRGWYTYTPTDGWIQTAQTSNPSNNRFVAAPIYCVYWDDADASNNTFYVGTDKQIIRSTDGGLTFSQKTKGLEAGFTLSVAAVSVTVTDSLDNTVVKERTDGIYAGTTNNGVIFNKFYNQDVPSKQAFGRIHTTNFSDVQTSYLFPGAIVAQSTGGDFGLQRSVDRGKAFEQFYNSPYGFPQVKGTKGMSFPYEACGNVAGWKAIFIDRNRSCDKAGEAVNNNPNNAPSQSIFAMDEYIPQALIDSLSGNGAFAQQYEGHWKDTLQRLPHYLFYGSKSNVWMVMNPVGSIDKKSPYWNRITDGLITDGTEFITTMAVSPDGLHNVYVGTSKGRMFKIMMNIDFEKEVNNLITAGTTDTLNAYDAKLGGANVSELTAHAAYKGKRWMTSIAVDPSNTNRMVVTYAGFGDLVTATDMVFVVENGTATPLTGGANLAQVPTYVAKFVKDKNSGKMLLYVGNENGLYYTEIDNLSSGAVNWVKETMGGELLNTPVTDIFVREFKATVINEITKQYTLTPDNTMYVASLGKGVYFTTSYNGREGSAGTTPEIASTFASNLYPNPTRGSNEVTIETTLPENAVVTYELMTVEGKSISAIEANLTVGTQSIELLTNALAEGVYLVKITAKGTSQVYTTTKKLVVVK